MHASSRRRYAVRGGVALVVLLNGCEIIAPLDSLNTKSTSRVGDPGGSAGEMALGGAAGMSGSSSVGAGAGGTGGVGTAGEAGGAGAPDDSCDPAAPFETAAPLTELNSGTGEEGITLSDDELTTYFSSRRDSGLYELFEASRENLAAPFTGVVKLSLSTADYDTTQPSLSSSGFVLYFTLRDVTQVTLLRIAIRPTVPGVFTHNGVASPGDTLNTTLDEAFMSSDSATFYFSGVPEGGGSRDIFASRVDQGAVEAGVALSISSSEHDERAPVLSADQLTMYFASDEPVAESTDTNVWLARRERLDDAFGPRELLETVVSQVTTDEWPEAISADGCRLYFVRQGTGAPEIFVARRGAP